MSLWDRRYAEYGALWGHFPATSAEELWWRMKSSRARRVLVAGCAYGRHVAYFARRGFRVTGLDASETAIAMAHASARDDGLKVALTRAPATRMPFPDGSFDAVYDHALLHHLPAGDRAATVAEYRRVLRPDGLLVVSALSTADPEFGLGPEREPGSFEGADGRLEHFFGEQELRDALAGFEIDSVRTVEEPAEEDCPGADTRVFLWAVGRRAAEVRGPKNARRAG